MISDPRPGTIVEVAPGSHLAVRFRRGLGPSQWHLAGIPGHVLVLADGGHDFPNDMREAAYRLFDSVLRP